jgi:Acyl-protein synthetase, LuxE
MTLEEYISIPQYSLKKEEKESLLHSFLDPLYTFHLNNSTNYKRIISSVFPEHLTPLSVSDFPFLPVSSFKNFEIKSIPDDKVYKVLTSSGTTGTVPSKIYLDTETAKLQTVALSKIMGHVLGKERLPMLILDSKEVLKNRNSFSARGAGILGYSIFGKEHTYLLDENYEIDYDTLDKFLEKHNGKPIFIFGFTFMIWQYFVQKISRERNVDLSNGIMVHGGGWKKLIEQSVDNQEYKRILNEVAGIKQIYNFYGMVEQVGSVFLENSQGYLHCPNFADVIIRNPIDFSPQPIGEEGLIQVVSVLPKSYPGFSLLTEDVGVLMGEDNAENGWKGKYFKILGRAKKAELRGCSDTFAEKFNT